MCGGSPSLFPARVSSRHLVQLVNDSRLETVLILHPQLGQAFLVIGVILDTPYAFVAGIGAVGVWPHWDCDHIAGHLSSSQTAGSLVSGEVRGGVGWWEMRWPGSVKSSGEVGWRAGN